MFSFVGLAWVNSSSDLARYQRPASSGAQSMLWATVGATLPPFALIAWGALLAASDPVLATGLATSPLPTIARMLPLWYPAPLLAAAGLGLLSSVVVAMYSGGFALQAVGLKTRRSVSTLLSAILVAAVAAGLVVLVGGRARDRARSRDHARRAGSRVGGHLRRRDDDPHPHLRLAVAARPGGVYPQVRIANLLGVPGAHRARIRTDHGDVPRADLAGLPVPADRRRLGFALATSDVGVLVALVLGLLVPIVAAIPAIRRQERDPQARAHRPDPAPAPSRATGSIPRRRGTVAGLASTPPRLDRDRHSRRRRTPPSRRCGPRERRGVGCPRSAPGDPAAPVAASISRWMPSRHRRRGRRAGAQLLLVHHPLLLRGVTSVAEDATRAPCSPG